jgi:hypothetical protein
MGWTWWLILIEARAPVFLTLKAAALFWTFSVVSQRFRWDTGTLA